MDIWLGRTKLSIKNRNDWKKIEKNKLTIALKALYTKKGKIYSVYALEHKSKCEKQVILLMISSREWWHYLAVKETTSIIKITYQHWWKKIAIFIVSIVFILLEKTNKLESQKKVCENKDFCNIVMPFEDTKILELNKYQKSDKATFIIYSDFECLIEKIDRKDCWM